MVVAVSLQVNKFQLWKVYTYKKLQVTFITFAKFCAIPLDKLHQPEQQTFLYRVYVLSLTWALQLP
jgi:hypothetical protein